MKNNKSAISRVLLTNNHKPTALLKTKTTESIDNDKADKRVSVRNSNLKVGSLFVIKSSSPMITNTLNQQNTALTQVQEERNPYNDIKYQGKNYLKPSYTTQRKHIGELHKGRNNHCYNRFNV